MGYRATRGRYEPATPITPTTPSAPGNPPIYTPIKRTDILLSYTSTQEDLPGKLNMPSTIPAGSTQEQEDRERTKALAALKDATSQYGFSYSPILFGSVSTEQINLLVDVINRPGTYYSGSSNAFNFLQAVINDVAAGMQVLEAVEKNGGRKKISISGTGSTGSTDTSTPGTTSTQNSNIILLIIVAGIFLIAK